MATGLPRVTIQPTRDLTYRVPPRGGTGVGCIVVNARKGPVDEPVFVANETEYLRTFCPDETISVGDDEAHYSALNFLREGAGLWVVRPSPNGVYAALRVGTDNPGNYGLTTGAGTERRSGSSADNSTVTLEDLLAAPDMPNDDGNIYTIFAKSPGKWGNNISVAFAETEDDTLDLPSLDFRKKLGDAMPHTFTIPAVSGQHTGVKTVYLPVGLTGTPTVTGGGEDDWSYRTGQLGDQVSSMGEWEFNSSTGAFIYQARNDTADVRVEFNSVGNANSLSYTVHPRSTHEQEVILPDDLRVEDGSSDISHTIPAPGVGDRYHATDFFRPTPETQNSDVDAPGEWRHESGTTFRYFPHPTIKGRATITFTDSTPDQIVDIPTGNAVVTTLALDSSNFESIKMSVTDFEEDPEASAAAVDAGREWNQDGSKVVLHYKGVETGTLTISTDFNLPSVTLTPEGTGLGALSIGGASRIEEIVSISLADNRRLTSQGTGSTQFQHPAINPATGSNSLEVTAPAGVNLRGATVFGKYRTAEEKSRARQLIVSYKGPGDDAPVEQERFTVSHYKDLKDSYGRSVYAPDSTASSKYIAVKVAPNALNKIPMKTIVYAENPTPGATSPQESTTGSVAQERTLSQGADGSGLEGRGKLSDSGDLYEKLVDVDNYGFSYIMDGGEDGIRGTLAKIAEERKDCVAVLSTNPDGDGVAATGTATTAAALKGGEGTDNSFAAMYSPHVEIYDKFNDRNLIVPPDGFAAAVMARTARNNRPWTAPAGNDYGSLRSFPIVSLAHRYSEKLAGNLYDRSINPIIFKPGEGHLIFGQKTTQSRPSALDRLNVRLLMNETLTRIKGFLTSVVFKENDIQTRSVIRTRVGSYMARVQAGRGVYSYQVVCDETNNLPEDIDSNVLNVWVMMKPRKTSEYVNLLGVLTPTGASFSEAQGQL